MKLDIGTSKKICREKRNLVHIGKYHALNMKTSIYFILFKE